MKRIIPIAMLLAACAHSTPRIMTWAEYAKREVSWPYIVRSGALLYYGANHTYKPDDPQIAQIQKLWSEFHPDIALNEGGNPPVAATIDAAVTQYGEAGLIRFLARRDDVPVVSIDPTRAEETAFLSKTYTREQIKMFFLVRGIAQQIQNHDPNKVDDELTRILGINNEAPGLTGSPRTTAEFAQIYRQYFPDGDYKSAKISWFDPMKDETLFNAMARAGSEYRDRCMVAMLQRHLREGERVFAVVGGTHVVMQEPALLLRASHMQWMRSHGASFSRDRVADGMQSQLARRATAEGLRAGEVVERDRAVRGGEVVRQQRSGGIRPGDD